MHDSLRASLSEKARELSQAVLDRMYENPFWMERYGARGRQFADQDSLYHLQYLDQALAADDPAVFEKYSRWLRDILVSRGMCSEHLAENFRLLAQAITASDILAPERALLVLDRGVQALQYTEGEAGRVEQRRPELLAVIDEASGASHMRDDDKRYLLSYVVDSLAGNSASGFRTFADRCDVTVVDALLRAITSPSAHQS